MVMELLDSNAIIYLSKELVSIDDIINDQENTCISVITYMEVLGYKFESNDEEIFIKKLLSYLEVIYIDKPIVGKVIELRKEYKIKLPDAIICSTAICHSATLVTNDLRLKVINELKLKLIKIIP